MKPLNYTYFTIYGVQCPIPGRKTSLFDVIGNSGKLGTIAWFGRWREYCFYPQAEAVWSAGCLAEIKQALDVLNARHKDPHHDHGAGTVKNA